MRIPLLLLVVAMLGLGCNRDDAKAIEAKCDAALRLRAEELAGSNADAPLEVLGRTEGPVDAARRERLEGAGATLGSVTEDLFTARIPVKRLGDVALLDFVKSLALSQVRGPLGH